MRVLVFGSIGMVGSAIVQNLSADKKFEVVGFSRAECDVEVAQNVACAIEKIEPDVVVLAAARVGGIHANNQYPFDFLYRNLLIQNNVINASLNLGVKKLLFLGSSCIYPKYAKQPITEDELLNGKLEKTNAPYAIAKIAGINLCEAANRQFGVDYRAIMPCNLYGPGDNYHGENSHVIPALIKKIHQAAILQESSVSIWGSGGALREFLDCRDLANACKLIMTLDSHTFQKGAYPNCFINVGSGEEISIRDLALAIAEIVGYAGDLIFDNTKPEGTPRKVLDSSQINKLGWRPKISLKAGLEGAYEDYLQRFALGKN